MRRFFRRRAMARLRAEGWHLVKTPQWTEQEDGLRRIRHIKFHCQVDDWLISISEQLTEQQIVLGPSDVLYKVRGRMIRDLSEALLGRLA